MANNKIQIKRSISTAITNTTPTVSNGELIFTSNGYIFAIGDPANSANVISIGGARYPGVLTANQALVANTTSGIDKIITANLQVTGTANISGLVSLSGNLVLSNTSAIVANGTVGTAGQVLSSNATTVYWATPAVGVAGSDTQVQYNDGGNLAGATGLTFTKASNNVTIANTLTVTSIVNAASHNSGITGTGTGGTVQNTTVMFVGNNTINTVITSAGLNVNGATIANNTGVYTGIVNATSHTSGATGTGTGGIVANSTVYFIGNNTVNAAVNTTTLYIGGNVIANSTGANNAFNLGGTAKQHSCR